MNAFKDGFKDGDVSKGIVRLGFDFNSKKVAQVLQIVSRYCSGAVEVSGKLEGADYFLRLDPFFLQHADVEFCVVRHDDVALVAEQLNEFFIRLASLEGRLVFNHLVGDVMYRHRVHGNGNARVKKFRDRTAHLRLVRNLAEPVVRACPRCFRIKKNKH